MGILITLLDGKRFGKKLYTKREFRNTLERISAMDIDEVFVQGELVDDDRIWAGILDVQATQADLTIGEY